MDRGAAPDRTGDETPAKTVARLTVRPQFLFVRDGETIRKKSLVVQARKRGSLGLRHIGPDQIGEGFTATRKIGNAVARNRSKRRLRAASQQLLPRYGRAGVDYVFIARQNTAKAEWTSLLDDMETALVSLGARLADEEGSAD